MATNIDKALYQQPMGIDAERSKDATPRTNPDYAVRKSQAQPFVAASYGPTDSFMTEDDIPF
jgi:hypothetical protein